MDGLGLGIGLGYDLPISVPHLFLHNNLNLDPILLSTPILNLFVFFIVISRKYKHIALVTYFFQIKDT